MARNLHLHIVIDEVESGGFIATVEEIENYSDYAPYSADGAGSTPHRALTDALNVLKEVRREEKAAERARKAS